MRSSNAVYTGLAALCRGTFSFGLLAASLLLATALFLVRPALASDTEYIFRYHRGDSTIATLDFEAGIPTYIEVRYDIATEVLKFEMNLLPPTLNPANYLAKGFNLIINGGQNLHFGGGEVAVFYFDATVPSAPRLTVYPYNAYVAFNDSLSYEDAFPALPGIQTPDRLCTSTNPSGCGGWLQQLQVVEEANGSRTFRFKAKVSSINDHVPTWPNTHGLPWLGTGFQGKIGMHLMLFGHPTTTFTYRSDGFIDQLLIPIGADHLGAINTCLMPPDTAREPYCLQTTGTLQVSPGQTATASFGAFSPDGDLLTVTYSGVPAGASINPPSGSSASGTLRGTFAWTPNNSNANITTTVTPTFSDNNGFTVSCPFNLTVGALGPQCTDSDISATILALDNNAEAQLDNIRKLTSRYVSVTSGSAQAKAARKYRGTVNKKANELFVQSWTLIWTQVPRTITSCTNAEQCVTVSHASALNGFATNNELLYQLAVDTEAQIKKVGGKAKRLAKKALSLRNANTATLATVPTSTTSCN